MEATFTELSDTELDEVFGGYATICSCAAHGSLADSCVSCNLN